MATTIRDVIIIGGGPAGLTAAVYAARKTLNVLLITKDIGGQALYSVDVENYMGYQFISGQDLMDRFEEQVEKYHVEQVFTEVKTVTKERDGTFTLRINNDEEYRTRTMIIATGKKSRTLDAKGLDTYIGRGVSYCATCDAPLFVDQDVAVIGGGNSAFTAAYELMSIARKMYIVNRSPYTADEIYREKIQDAPNVEQMIGFELDEVKGNDTVTTAIFRNRADGSLKPLPVAGVFIEIGLIPNSDFVKDLVHLNEANEIVVSCDCATNIPGVFAAGDVTTVPEKQIIVAAGEGGEGSNQCLQILIK